MTAVPVELRRRDEVVRVPTSPGHMPELLPLDAGEQYRFGFSMSVCIGCHSCEVACAEQNGLPDGIVWRRVGEVEGGTFPDTRRLQLSMSCNHCLDAACLTGCPTNAYEKLDNGVVAHHADECIGCQYCTWNCPYSVPVFQPDRRIVTKCDMCLPRLGEGLLPACAGACPTHAITVEPVNIEAWRADHAAADMPHLPSSHLTISTTRIELPDDVPASTVAASDWSLRPEHAHWPLVWLTVLTQVAAGVSITASGAGDRAAAAGLAVAALIGSLAHLGRPGLAWKALRNLRRSWLSREVALFGVYAPIAMAAVLLPALAPLAALVGMAGVYASARLYIVPGRPAWNTPLTMFAFAATGLAVGPLVTGHEALGAAGTVAALVVLVANVLRLSGDPEVSRGGTPELYRHRLRGWTVLRVVLALTGLLALTAGLVAAAAALVVAGEVVGRWLFYVTVVPANMPGSFWRSSAGTHK
ncbi:MAG: DmsC/YnfH family molybdoenzyme membrane anchor subunit [Acidimicrobiales bacterium]|nr:DmsC/YnfH family molybdoenzyme membrane anchor subunit [Acidimicrobiales bacterium]